MGAPDSPGNAPVEAAPQCISVPFDNSRGPAWQPGRARINASQYIGCPQQTVEFLE